MQIDYFDKLNLLRIIGRKLRNIASEKWLNLTEWSNLIKWLWQWDLSLVLNGKKWVSSEKLTQIAEAIWISKDKLDKIVAESKKEELRIYYWEEIHNLPTEWLDLTDYEKEELWKVLFSKVVWVEPTKEDVEVMLEMIRMSNRNKR